MIYKSMAELIGNTPLVELTNFQKAHNLNAKILAKLESFNPTGSVKDRAAYYMINAEKSDFSVIIEPTSGNTGIALAALAAQKNMRIILVMPANMSRERQKIMHYYGAETVLTEPAKGMRGAIEKARELHAQIAGSVILGQFENAANPLSHYETTAPEIWRDTGGSLDIFVAGVGTGGTISGAGKYFKERNENIRIFAVEPAYSPVLSQGKKGAHGIQGIGAGFVPETLNSGIYEGVIAVTDENAIEFAREIARTDGISAGLSSGAALCAATRLAVQEENKGKSIVVIFPDGGEKYCSTPLYS